MFDTVLFYAFNFYSKDNSMVNYEPMLESAKAHGLTPFIDAGPNKIKIVNHTDCWYEK